MTSLTLPHAGTITSALHSVFVKPFQTIGRGLVYMAEHQGTYRHLKQIAQMTDAQFEAKGTTREEAIRRAIGGYV